MLLALFLAALIAGLEYFRFQGLKNTLIAMVDEQTNGTYRLVIGESEIDFVNLSMKLSDAAIESTTDERAGIERIEIPEIFIDFGSLVSLFNRKQVVIQEFHVTEPIANLYLTPAPDQEPQEPQKPLNLAHEIGQIFPFVEDLLDEFDIISFQINRSNVNLTQVETENTIRIGLITLLINNWNMRDLSDQASILLELGPQEIPINRSKIAFDSIRYDYHNRLLSFRNFHMWQYDTAGRQTVHLRDANLHIYRLDWDALMLDELYILEEVRIESAKMKSVIYANQQVPAVERQPRHPLANFLKENLGQLGIRKGGISDTDIELMVHLPDDSVVLSLPKFNLEFEEFHVRPDSNTVMFELLELDLANAELVLDNDLSLSFEHLHYKDGVDLIIDDIELRHESSEYDVIECEQLSLHNFSIFTYLFEKNLKADSAILTGGNIVFKEPPSELRPRPASVSVRKKPIALNIDKLIFKEMDLLYDYGAQRFHASGINGVMDEYQRYDREAAYTLRYFTTSKVTFADTEKDVDATIRDLTFRPRELQLRSFTGNFSELSFAFSNLVASPENFNLKKPFYYAWNSLKLGSVQLSGKLPPPGNGGGPEHPIRISEIELDKLNVDVQGDSQQFKVTGDEIRFTRVGYADGNLEMPQANALLRNILIRDNALTLQIEEAQINNQQGSDITRISLETESLSGSLDRLQMGPWVYKDKGISLAQGILKKITLIQSGRTSSVDSISLDNFSWQPGGEPSLNRLTVHSPHIHIETAKSQAKDTASSSPRPLKWVNELLITPGDVRINDQVITFGMIDLVRGPEHLQAEVNNISYATPTTSLHLEKFKTTQDDIILEGFDLNPVPGYEPELEGDIFDGRINNLEIQDVAWTALIEDHTLNARSLTIDGFDIEIRRDKRLPDPPGKIKPFLFGKLIPRSEHVQIPLINVKEGNITYRETSDKTGKQGVVHINDIKGTVRLEKEWHEMEEVLTASARLYDSALFTVNYVRLDSTMFSLQVGVENLYAPLLNQMADSLEAVKLKSGMIPAFAMSIEGNNDLATGSTLITYEDLHIEIFKKGSPEETNLGSELLTLLADGIILKHSKYDAIGEVNQERFKEKGPINYWVKSLVHGALSAVRTGKSQKKPKRKRKRKTD